MGLDEKLVKLEKMATEIEGECDLEKVMARFSEATTLAKEVLADGKVAKGRVLEIVHEMDEWIAKEFKNSD